MRFAQFNDHFRSSVHIEPEFQRAHSIHPLPVWWSASSGFIGRLLRSSEAGQASSRKCCAERARRNGHLRPPDVVKSICDNLSCKVQTKPKSNDGDLISRKFLKKLPKLPNQNWRAQSKPERLSPSAKCVSPRATFDANAEQSGYQQ